MAGKIIAVRVLEGDKIVLDWYALKVGSKEIFTSLFEKVIAASEEASPGNRFKHPIVLKDTTYSRCDIVTGSGNVEVGWGLCVQETLECFNSSRVSFVVKQKSETPPARNAFTELFAAQKTKTDHLMSCLIWVYTVCKSRY